MDKALKQLFDFQKFEGNSALQGVIDSVHSRYAMRELNLDEMESVSAAGTPVVRKDEKEQEKKKP